MELEDGSQLEKDFEKDIEEWKPSDQEHIDEYSESDVEVTENYLLSSILTMDDVVDDVYKAEIIDKKEYGREDIQEAMLKEIQKYKSFEAI